MKNADFQRLEKVMQCKQIASFAEFSRLIGAKTPQIFTAIKSGKNKISRTLAVSIHDVFPDISASWLLTGEGGMYIDNRGDIHHNKVGGDLLGNGATKNEQSDLTAVIVSQQRSIERLIEQNARLTEMLEKSKQ